MLAVFQVCIRHYLLSYIALAPHHLVLAYCIFHCDKHLWNRPSVELLFFIIANISDNDWRGLECRDVWWDSCIRRTTYNRGNLIITVLRFSCYSGELYPLTHKYCRQKFKHAISHFKRLLLETRGTGDNIKWQSIQ